MAVKYSLFAIIFSLFVSCSHTKKDSSMTNDPHSFANPSEAVITHLDLDIAVDFEKKIISGKATYDIDVREGASQIILDTRKLTIEKVTFENDKPATYNLGEEVKFLGQPLTINL